MRKHVSLDELALLDAGALKPRKAAKVRSHLAHCGDCSREQAALGAVPSMLASVPYEPLPDSVSSRLNSAIAAESAHRLAAQPGTEAGRGMLPERSGRSGVFAGAGRGLRMPRLSGPAVRALATAGAVAVIVGGGIGIATQLGGGGVSSSSSASGAGLRGPAGIPAHHPGLIKGPSVFYGHGRRIQEVYARTNFVPAKFTVQVKSAVRADQTSGFNATSQSFGSSLSAAPTPASTSATSAPQLSGLSATANATAASGGADAAGVPPAGQIGACVDGVVRPGQTLQLLEHAKFEGKPATIIVTLAPVGRPEKVWVLGDRCSATDHDVLFSGTVPNTG